MKAYVEGYGCSLNQSDTDTIRSFLASNRFSIVSSPEQADLIVINTCAVKTPTEFKMLRRISSLKTIAETNNSLLVVFGCLVKINPGAVPESPRIVLCPPALEELASLLEFPSAEFSPLLPKLSSSEIISIIPISRGCLGDCSFCAVKNARGSLKSYSVSELKKAFKRDFFEEGKKEIWLTSQDTACYGADTGSSLPALISSILEVKGDYRLRIGMMNPGRILPFLEEFLSLFEDERLYRFLHIPLQSGSDSILEKMNRPYSVDEFQEIVSAAGKKFKDFSISTDVIVGFPGETETDFQMTVSALEKAEPYITNISRYGDRPGTSAEKMLGKIIEREKKRRSRFLSKMCRSFSLEQNKALLGTVQKILVSQPGCKGNFVGRTQSYKQIVIQDNKIGEFCSVKLLKAFPSYLEASLSK